MSDAVRSEADGPVSLITIDRPERRNAVDHATLSALREALAESVGGRVVILTGASGHFCAGADLTGVEDEGFAAALRALLDAIAAHPAPVIAAVTGAALGAGTQLAVACDLRVASPDARFGIPAARLGLMVDHWTVQRLALLAGHGPARAMLLAAEQLTGAEAHGLGLVQRLGDLDAARDWAGEIATLAPLTIAGHKLMLNRLERALGDDAEVDAAFRRAWRSADLAEGMAAFRERRTPTFHGR
jgi:enoyl-CoA hydratase/carnithine racemase